MLEKLQITPMKPACCY